MSPASQLEQSIQALLLEAENYREQARRHQTLALGCEMQAFYRKKADASFTSATAAALSIVLCELLNSTAVKESKQ